MSVKVLYFAWVREKVGKAEESLDVPAGVETAQQLITWLKQRGPEYAEAFARAEVIRVALDRTHVQPTASIAGAREIAFFPPVTGG
jgi:molybdopterin synthase sulfur carrier subunit